MSDDIAERLRDWRRDAHLGRKLYGCDLDLREAADEIERLRDQLWYLKGQLEVIADSEPCTAECGFPGYARALLKKECKDD